MKTRNDLRTNSAGLSREIWFDRCLKYIQVLMETNGEAVCYHTLLDLNHRGQLTDLDDKFWEETSFRR